MLESRYTPGYRGERCSPRNGPFGADVTKFLLSTFLRPPSPASQEVDLTYLMGI